MNNAPTEWSELEVAEVQGKSRLISCKNVQPLKILNPRSPAAGCHAVLSSYGGGMVAGDKIWLRLTGHANSRLFLGSQANTKIFKSLQGAAAEHVIEGKLGAGALAVVFPDPVVMQERSQYRQVQQWDLQPDSLLLVIDWFHSGRMDIGEKFVFTAFHSELKVAVNQRVVLLDRFAFAPQHHIATSPANFDQYQTMFSAYLVGNPTDARFQYLADALLQLKMSDRTDLHFAITNLECMISVTKVKEEAYILRAMAHSRMALQPLCDHLLQALSGEEFFGYNPLKRKY
ncbi:urease accessory protein UreD [Hymenobacter jejuensis]|uniref:Urease accessory protein UreD n=1 Tax=Hymenobacter jejuensis TaxID=2502781 RepID=A0A5B8A3K5_9BACT|nr:urease accessory protein UreD [Hymenobacter jejuensis]QDA61215.1 hypothetical protein FHG12_14400 [Hymenobacter jejuensis]